MTRNRIGHRAARWAVVGALAAAGTVPAVAMQAAAETPAAADPWSNVLAIALTTLIGGGGLGYVAKRVVDHIIARSETTQKTAAEQAERVAREAKEAHEAELAEQRSIRADYLGRLDDLRDQIARVEKEAIDREQRVRAHYEREVADWKQALDTERKRSDHFVAVLWGKYPEVAADVRRQVVLEPDPDSTRGIGTHGG